MPIRPHHIPLLIIILIIYSCMFVPRTAFPSEQPYEASETVSDPTLCLSLNIYHEARGESTEGWLAVAFVSINRMNDQRFPNDLCGVIYQSRQFSWTHDGISDTPDLSQYADRQAWKYIQQFSKGFLENYENIVDPTEGSLYYHSNKVTPYWSDHFRRVIVIGDHVFYSED